MGRLVVVSAAILQVVMVALVQALPASEELPVQRTAIRAMLVFGDSSVDSGNNNNLRTTFKANFLPYGRDFFRGHPSGRFSNGRLPTDFIGTLFSLSLSLYTIYAAHTEGMYVGIFIHQSVHTPSSDRHWICVVHG
ncbi:hypothetical protein Taro_047975 [Colocasia esculenta]|uniref:GDSL esterase/lipase n=1 Tax=Colocasia esculenta TaxID=4460 RepID=A0A843X4L7_COLES|nr:hypothetical protein [Colocasia esculenta]